MKRIWTPSWTLFSGGVCFLMLAAFAWVIEAKGYRKWAFPLVVIGMNSIAAYLIAHLLPRVFNFCVSYSSRARCVQDCGTGAGALCQGMPYC